ncbi:MAG: DNA repair protein RecO [Tissierellia bacterium]|nr:DNA repair protein RecO [Tissierellia bacterium]MDD3226694.1 DNA repair protein RecO [Tissierellia bacterium]MDD4046138.1 DNA repair protein RecO [Tissierellia bacterium]MDD4679082.1 DNA repair protein RecO [Tissierellia bacterium]
MIQEDILILKEISYKENDKILHALSRTRGKIQIISKGSKKSNSHLINASQIFAYSRCTLNVSKDMYILTSASLLDNFYNLNNNIDAYYNACYILELISYVAQENEVDSKVFDMTVSVISHLSNFNKDFDKLTASYELKLAAMLGYKPDFLHCLHCGSSIKDAAKFSVTEGGVFCSKCVKFGNGINVKYNEILIMDKILKSKFENIGFIEVTESIMNLIRKFLFYYIGKDNFTTLRLL